MSLLTKRKGSTMGFLVAKKARAAQVVITKARRNRAPRSRVKGPIRHTKELKYVDVTQANYACDTTGSVTALNLIAVGDDNTTRDGRQVTIKSVQLHGYLVPADGTTTPSKNRVMLVWDNAVNSGTIATIAQIMTGTSGVVFPLVDNANRFTILVDRCMTIGGIDTTATQTYAMAPTVADIEIYKIINQVTQYSGTTAAIGSIQNGGLLMVTMDSNAAATGAIAVIGTRVRFTDD